MLGTPKIKTIRQGLDARTGLPIDMAFDTDYELHMFAKATRSTTGINIPHGMLYTPEVVIMEEFSSIKRSRIVGYQVAGSREWVCPAGVTSITVHLWGGGGAGGGLTIDNKICRGGGGAGGQYARKTVAVTENTSYTVVVGAGGIGSTGNGTAGGDSSFENLAIAKGGAGGQSYEAGAAGGVGSTSGGVGDVVRAGGSGSNGGTSLYGGAGGGAAGTNANGGNASGNNGGLGGLYNYIIGYDFGNTGNGADNYSDFSHDGWSGDYYASGGAAGSNVYDFYTTDRIGGNGTQGQVFIEYEQTIFSGKAMGNRNGNASVDKDYVNAPNSYLHSNKSDAVWVYTKIHPIPEVPENDMLPIIKKGYPVIKVGNEQYEQDWKKRLNTYFDAQKIFKTGNLTIHKDEVLHHNGDQLEEITKVTYNHNLGYIPIFSPNINTVFSIPEYYDWLNQYYYRGDWTSGLNYWLKERVTDPDTTETFECLKSHIADINSRPNTGVNKDIYWHKITDTTEYNLNINELEDIKFVFGGVEIMNEYNVYFYATDTQLVLGLRRITYDWEGIFLDGAPFPNEPLMETTVSVDFTIFSNRADQEYNLLLN